MTIHKSRAAKKQIGSNLQVLSNIGEGNSLKFQRLYVRVE